LHSKHRCIALDLRGHGDSEWSHEGEYGIEAHLADLEKAVQWLRLEKFVLVGMSLGGITALAYAGRWSDMLKGLVLVDIGPSGGRHTGVARIRDFTSGPEEHETVEAFVEKAMNFNPLRTPERLRRSLLHNLRKTPHGTWTWKYDRRHRMAFRADDAEGQRLRESRRRMLWEAIGKVRCPTLVVRGALSDVFLDEDARETVEALAHGRFVTIEGAGHTVQGDRPYELIDALRDFLIKDVDVFRT
jgi:pimeloyl-ACP methyl ester carboxylesterase